MNRLYLDRLILSFLEEDLGFAGDITTSAMPGRRIVGEFVAGEPFIVCGIPVVERVFKLLDPCVAFSWNFSEGSQVKEGDVIGRVEGESGILLTCERTALNIFQRLSGVATETRKYVKVLEGTGIKLLDTRKTTPGLRYLEKYAVRIGGAVNHRFGLFDAVMVKDNHIRLCGGVAEAVRRVAGIIPATAKIEVEVENWKELEELFDVIDMVDIVMLDNWSVEDARSAVKEIKKIRPSVKIEISGGITLEKLKEIRELPVDFVSTSKMVTGASWVDVSMEVR